MLELGNVGVELDEILEKERGEKRERERERDKILKIIRWKSFSS